MASRLLVRIRTTVSGNTAGPRDLQLRAALVAQGFLVTSGDQAFLDGKTLTPTSIPEDAETPAGAASRADEVADAPVTFSAESGQQVPASDDGKSSVIPRPRSSIGRIVSTTRAAWRKARGMAAADAADNTAAARYTRTRRPSWTAVSHDIDGQDIRQILLQQGFSGREFRIHMEFQRGWGCL